MTVKREKQILLLKEPTRRSINAVIEKLKTSKRRFRSEADKLEPGEQKDRLLLRIDKISKELKAVEKLCEEDIISFALSQQRSLMVIAANKRTPFEDRIKARVASHRPLYSYLVRVKQESEQVNSEAEEEESHHGDKDRDEDLNKMNVNNQIVKMRNSVKRAKLHVINHFTRRLKMCRSYKGEGKIKKKYERQAERILKKLSYIQKLEPDEVSRFAITNELDLSKLAVDIKAPLRTQALATLASHKFVADSVETFKLAHPNCHKTVPKILMKKKKKRKLLVSEQRNNNEKTKSDDEMNTLANGMEDDDEDEESNSSDSFDEEQTIKKAIVSDEEMDHDETIMPTFTNDANSSSDSKEEGSVNSEIISDEEMDRDNTITPRLTNDVVDYASSTENDSSNEIEHSQEHSSEESEFKKERRKKMVVINSTNKTEIPQNEEDINCNKKQKSEILPPLKKAKLSNYKVDYDRSNEDHSSNEIENSQENSFEESKFKKEKRKKMVKIHSPTLIPQKEVDTNCNTKQKSEKSPPPKKAKVPDKPKVVDPFFMTATNEEYLTSQVPVISNDSEQANFNHSKRDQYFSKPPRFNKFSDDSRQKRWNRSDNGGSNSFRSNPFNKFSKPFDNSFQRESNNISGRPVIDTRNRKERRKALQREMQEKPVEKLHPSWEAKKKLSTLASFQGKKITFN